MKFRLYLKDRTKETSRIYLDLRHLNHRYRITTNISVKSKNWDAKKQIVKSIDKNSFLLNTKIKNLSELIQEYLIINNYNNFNITSIEDIICNYNSKKSSNSKVIDFINKYKSKYANEKTQVTYSVFSNLIYKFNPNLDFNNINLNVLIDFKEYLMRNEYSNSYIVRIMKRFKTIIREYSRQNPNYNINYLNSFKVELNNYYSTLIALDEDEITEIKNVELNHRLQKVKDLFLIQCYTGLRISDLLNLKPENINIKRKELHTITIKTAEIIRIPISSSILTIFDKYQNVLPVISDVKYNQYIKEVCKLAGIDAPTLVTSWRGGKRVDTIKPKYELISSHTARRTFITRLLRKGLLPEQIMKITGHRNRRSFDEYVKITQSEAVNAVRSALE